MKSKIPQDIKKRIEGFSSKLMRKELRKRYREYPYAIDKLLKRK